MPNWCYNALEIEVSNNKQLEEVIQAITNDSKQPIDFERLLPTPAELLAVSAPNEENPQEMKDKYGFPDWYAWRCARWGTKWNASSSEINLTSPTSLSLTFNTAWSPPLPIIERIADKFPYAEITHYWSTEEGYWGEDSYSDGYQISQSSGEIDCEYRWEKWGECYDECSECGDCDCDLCSCNKRSRETLCKDCNNGDHTLEKEGQYESTTS